MSFLNSVISSINTGKGKGEISNPAVKAAPKRETTVSSTREGTFATKRKASNELSRPNDKLSKNAPDGKALPGSSKPSSAIARAPPGVATHRDGKIESRKPLPESTNAPKKGSLKDILARAKQNSTLQVGQLTHKPKEKVSIKKELALQREMAKKGKKGQHMPPSKNGGRGQPSSLRERPASGKDSTATSQKARIKSKPPPTYQGTAKPRAPQPAYRGTMMSREAPSKRGYDSEPGQSNPKHRQAPPRGFSDYGSEEENDSDDGYDYASDDYSDMDAGFDDVDEEEAAAEREAKKEDVREQKKLEDLARQKEEKKKRAKFGAHPDRVRGR